MTMPAQIRLDLSTARWTLAKKRSTKLCLNQGATSTDDKFFGFLPVNLVNAKDAEIGRELLSSSRHAQRGDRHRCQALHPRRQAPPRCRDAGRYDERKRYRRSTVHSAQVPDRDPLNDRPQSFSRPSSTSWSRCCDTSVLCQQLYVCLYPAGLENGLENGLESCLLNGKRNSTVSR
eukprot:CAMPEP_0171486112 /NCGR_PEP_ID=MMETSP0958-20121227/913_1 /TAXON_ID=87120 /ORGANISM="Aurantiochytrium limacinum, Strain ATCCMYA-1381" /LENGTH=175 /DNA_ID=CAMNT_0012018963 /DNA_START=1332 /DNA_END=1860 /DNA_ORIENTATION=-